MADLDQLEHARVLIDHIARVSEAVGFQAGVGASETAGCIISYLAAHPERLEAFLRDGFFALAPGEEPVDLWRHGRLSWMGADGKVHHPDQGEVQP